MTDVQRYDHAPLRKATRTDQGFLRAPARVTRAGVFEYVQDDGSVVRELRHPDDVFHADSLASLASTPITDLHPPVPVTAANVADYGRGFASETPRRDGNFVATDLTITHADLIQKCDTKVRSEISLGYSCKIVQESGVYQGERYDQRQTQIRYNHVALGPSGWGRAGSDVKLRMDSADAAPTPYAARFDDCADPAHIPGMDSVEIRIDGATVTVAKASADAVSRLDAALTQARADLAKANTDLGTATAALAVAKADLAKAADPATVTARVDARITLVTDARKVLGDEYKADGKTDAQVMRDAVAKGRPEIKLDGATDDFIAGAFRIVCDSVGQDSLAAVREPAARTDSAKPSAAKAREERIAKSAVAYKTLGKDGGK